jgi:long-chain acyl-CoA synthetase
VTFVARILERLARHPDHPFLREARPDAFPAATGAALARDVRRVRAFAAAEGLRRGDRCALLAPNSIAWVAADLGLLAAGVVVVPLYARARPEELARILADADPALLLADGGDFPEALRRAGAALPKVARLADVLAREDEADDPPAGGPGDPVKIFYTSGTSGEPKGVVLDASNVEPVLRAAVERLDAVVRGVRDEERVYHYLPFCFAGSWIALLACLERRAVLALNTDLARVVEDLAEVRPHWFQNVPVVLDRVRHGVEQALERRSGGVRLVARGAWRATRQLHRGESPSRGDRFALFVARRLLFPAVRQRVGPELRGLVCGSAPLSVETQLFFEMISLPVLQVYGLTETCAICTMDAPRDAVPGRVGRAIDGTELRLADDGEILVRGPNVFRGYWRNPGATAAAFADGWLRTGDRGEVDPEGRWRVLGRVKSLLVPSSGHKVAPEPLEERLLALLPGARQVVLLGDGRPHLAAIVCGEVDSDEVEAGLEELNGALPHYSRIRGSLIRREPFTVESGLLTANGKLRRAEIERRFARELDDLYEREAVRA